MLVGQVIRKRRKSLGLTQEDIAEAIGKDQNYVSFVETGRIKRPGRDVLRSFARALELDYTELLRVADYAPDGYEEVERPEFAAGPRVQYWGRVPADAVRWTAVVKEERTLPVQQEWIGTRSPDQFFVIRVSGDCLMQKGITDGSYVLCEKAAGRQPLNGQVVAIRVGGDRSLKIWHRTNTAIELRDGNGNTVATLTGADDIEVVGFWVADWRSDIDIEG